MCTVQCFYVQKHGLLAPENLWFLINRPLTFNLNQIGKSYIWTLVLTLWLTNECWFVSYYYLGNKTTCQLEAKLGD